MARAFDVLLEQTPGRERRTEDLLAQANAAVRSVEADAEAAWTVAPIPAPGGSAYASMGQCTRAYPAIASTGPLDMAPCSRPVAPGDHHPFASYEAANDPVIDTWSSTDVYVASCYGTRSLCWRRNQESSSGGQREEYCKTSEVHVRLPGRQTQDTTWA